MRLLIAILFITSAVTLNAQTYDSVFVKRDLGDGFVYDTLLIKGGTMQPQILVGTTVIPNSHKNIALLNEGIQLNSLKMVEECDGSLNPEEFGNYPQFKSIMIEDDHLIVDVGIVDYCGNHFLGEAVYENGNLDLQYIGYGMFAACECCYGLQYVFDITMMEEDQAIKSITIYGDTEVIGKLPD